MGSNVNVLKQGVHKIYEDLRPIPAYATPVKKGQNRQSVIENENAETTKDDVDEDPYETMTVRSNKNDDKREYDDVQTEFRSTFFGISKDHDSDSEEDTKSENSNEGDVTPTGDAIEDEEDEEKHSEKEEKPKKQELIVDDSAESSTEEVLSDTETIDVSLNDVLDANSSRSGSKADKVALENKDYDDEEGAMKDEYDTLMFKAVGASWDEVDVEETGLPPPLALHANIHTLKLDLLSSLFQNLYPTEEDCVLVRQFLSCPASLEEKYSMIRLSDLLKKNKRAGIELEDIAEAMSQLAKIGSELLRPEDDRDPLWRSIPVAKEIMVTKGIATRAPWEAIQVWLIQSFIESAQKWFHSQIFKTIKSVSEEQLELPLSVSLNETALLILLIYTN